MTELTTENLRRPNATVWPVSDLVMHAMDGRLRIPPFQRRFRWEARDIERLFDSIWRGYPVGSLLLWQRRAPQAHVEFGPVSFDAVEQADAYWVVDGQQRVTSLVGVLAAPEDVRGSFDLHFDLQLQTFRRPSTRRPPGHWLPLRVVVNTNTLLNWLLEFRAAGGSEELVDRATALGKAIREFQLPVSIVQTDDESFLRDIFDRLNTFGRRLTRAEVFQALHTALGEGEPSDLRSLVDEVADFGFGTLREDTVLRAVLAIRGGDVFRDFHDEFEDGADPAETYRATAEALETAFRFLQHRAAIPHARALPYAVVIPVLARFFHIHPDPSSRTLTLLRRWVWRGAIAGVGGGGGATAVLRRAVQAVVDDEYESAAALLDLIGPARPDPIDLTAIQLNRAAARSNLALLSSLTPLDFVSGEAVDVASLLDRQEGLDGLLRIADSAGRVGSLANVFIQDAGDDDAPADLIASATDEVLHSHAISKEGVHRLLEGSVDSFLAARGTELASRLEDARLALAEPDANDRPALEALLVPESDER